MHMTRMSILPDAVKSSQSHVTTLIWDDTDLLTLLLYYAETIIRHRCIAVVVDQVISTTFWSRRKFLGVNFANNFFLYMHFQAVIPCCPCLVFGKGTIFKKLIGHKQFQDITRSFTGAYPAFFLGRGGGGGHKYYMNFRRNNKKNYRGIYY